MKTIYLLSLGLLAFTQELFAQRISPQIGLNVVPLFDKTVEVNATVLRTLKHELFIQAGYTFPGNYLTDYDMLEWYYWRGRTRGAYLRLGGRVYGSKTGKLRPFLGTQVTISYLNQSGKFSSVLESTTWPGYSSDVLVRKDAYFLSAGITGGVKTIITPRLTLDLGIQANTYVFGKPDLLNNTVYVPGVGRKPVQGVASIQYTLKGR